jgi:hypothetical protein
MNDIVLQFVTEDALTSALIRWFSAGDFSHVDAVLPDGSLLGSRFEAMTVNGQSIPGGVQIRPPGYAKFKRVLKVSIPVESEKVDIFYNWWKSQIGKPYDMTAIIGFFIGRNWRKANSWYCSEGIARGMEIAKVFSYELYTATNKLTPAALLLAISAITNVEKDSVYKK